MFKFLVNKIKKHWKAKLHKRIKAHMIKNNYPFSEGNFESIECYYNNGVYEL